jgi:hypothetical protein
MKINRFRLRFQAHLDAIEKLIDENIAENGDTEKTSQRICLLNRLNSLQAALNGVGVADLKE